MPYKDIEKRREYQREYRRINYQKNKDKYQKSTLKWRNKNPDKVRVWSKNNYYRNLGYYTLYRIKNYTKLREFILKNKNKYNQNARVKYHKNKSLFRLQALIKKRYGTYLSLEIVDDNKDMLKNFIEKTNG